MYWNELEGVDDSDVFVAGRPDAGVVTFAVLVQGGFVCLLGEVENLVGELPDAGGERLVLLDRDDVHGIGFAGHCADDHAVERHLVDVAVAAAVGLEPAKAVAGLEVDDAVFGIEPVHPDLARDTVAGCTDDAFGLAVREELHCFGVDADGSLQLHDEAEILFGNDLAVLFLQPVGIRLGGLAEGFASAGIDGTIADDVVAVKGVTAFEDQGVCGASEGESGGFFRVDLPGNFLVVERGALAEVGQKMAGHVFAVAAAEVVAFRRFVDDEIGSASWKNYWHEFAEKHLYGIEINEQISRVAKMNMIIHDDGHTNIITNDGLKNNRTIEIENRNLNFQDGTFDLIMTNPPFGSTIKADEVPYYKQYELFEKNLGITEIKDRIIDDDNKNKWRTSQSTEVLFLERCYKYLNEENGYLAIVIPDGILTNSTSQYVRDWLIEHFRILAVVSLPQHTFSHVKAGVKSSILFLKKHPKELTQKFEQTLADIKVLVRKEKELDKEQRAERMLNLYKEAIFDYSQDYEILMLEVENVGYDATGKEIEGSELSKVAQQIKNFISNVS